MFLSICSVFNLNYDSMLQVIQDILLKETADTLSDAQ